MSALYGLCRYQLNSLLPTLEDRMTGVNFGRRGQRYSVLAYAKT